jgi:hypothetical protein
MNIYEFEQAVKSILKKQREVCEKTYKRSTPKMYCFSDVSLAILNAELK